ncbi:aminotransferase [Shewanella sp. GutCb]|uniref:aminotransferase n=1 Tax=Shewanella sp. GutCb TaxID=2058315 RepID=UPI000C7D48C9|nr:aminotransferase [Shewanella sp. GutCb]PKG74833.1 aminotransferase [Shewanella sp. GutCb]
MPLHECTPPNLDEWLEPNPSFINGYGHLLIEQIKANDDELLSRLKAYFESAHLDARQVIHGFMGISLHPDNNEKHNEVSYPSSLHLTTLKGFFGEVLAGLLAEGYELVGQHEWKVPVFLFRFHDDATKYLYTLVRDPDQKRRTIGRLGTDFIGVSMEGGEVSRLISGEAKWRKKLSKSVIDSVMLGPKKPGEQDRVEGKGVWAELNKEVNPPNGLRELQIALKEIDPEGHAEAILSMDKLLSAFDANTVPKTDLVLIVGGPKNNRETGECLIDYDKIPKNYLAGNDLQVVEIVLSDGESLIEDLYALLWEGDE